MPERGLNHKSQVADVVPNGGLLAPVPIDRDTEQSCDVVEHRHSYPTLSTAELAELGHFGEVCSRPAGTVLVTACESFSDSYAILAGTIRVIDASISPSVVFTRYGPGYFTGDVDLLTGLMSVLTIEAETDVLAVRLSSDDLRELFAKRPALGGKLWHAFQNRRITLLELAFTGLGVFGSRGDRETLGILELMGRNMIPHTWIDVDREDSGRTLVEASREVLPVVSYGSKKLLERASRRTVAEYIGLRRPISQNCYDLTIIGAGPCGLGAAVYAATEGLRVIVLDGLGPGGQAGSSSRIENYAGFPDGVNGTELAHLSYLQAVKFGAEFINPATVQQIERQVEGLYNVHTEKGDAIRAKSILIATGVSYRLLDATIAFRGVGVYYSATHIEAASCVDEPVHIVGSGNSAGQAAMFLSEYARVVTLVVRGPDLSASMSSYLTTRLLANEKIVIRYATEVDSIQGTDRIQGVVLRDQEGALSNEVSAAIFVFVGAKPRTDFLEGFIERDDAGYLLTGSGRGELAPLSCSNLPLETTKPGIFAAGDCRSNTAKRVAFAIGDGALAITCVHAYLRCISGAPNQVY